MHREPAELILPDALDATAVVARLAEQVELVAARPHIEDRVLLDTFDARLRAAGLRAERGAGRAATVTLSLIEPGALPRHAAVAPADALPAGELPAGPVRERLAPVLGVRALLPLARVRSRVQPLRVLDGAGKTVVRVSLEQPAVVRGRTRVALPARLHVHPVRGYDKQFERTLALLTGKLRLVSAAAPLFDEAVLAAGGRPEGRSSKIDVSDLQSARADAAAGAVLGRLADVAEANLAGALADLDSEFLHDLRVAVRRARALLRELRGVHGVREREHVRGELRWLQALTGPVRDLDVQLLEWEELTDGLPPERAADLEALRALLERRRLAARRALVRGLRSARCAEALAAWRALASSPPAAAGDADRPAAALAIEAVAADRIRSVHGRLVRDGGRIGDDSPDEALHDLRKRGKELRYLLELFGSLFPDAVVKPMVKALKELQDVLGRFQDRAVQCELLSELAPELAGLEGGPAALMASGLVVQALAADQRAARAAFAERFAHFSAREQRKLVRGTFPALAAS